MSPIVAARPAARERRSPYVAPEAASSSRTPGRDAVRFGTAVAAAVALGVVQLFVIPRRLDVAAFGAWRVFLVYAGYLGALHLGLADGAFLRWAGWPARVVAREWPRVAAWVLAVHALLLGAALAAGAHTLVVALAACAAGMNLATLAGYALQTVGDFRGAGLVAALPPALFVAAAVGLRSPSLGTVLGAYAASFGVTAVVGAWRVRRATRTAAAMDAPSEPLAARALVRAGAPVLGANLAAGVSLFADRILVSASVPVARFALYGFASSVMVAASAATQALSRVALSHAARRGPAVRARFLDGYHDLIAALAGGALLLLPAFEALVARLLPAYVPALPIVRALAVGAPFGVAVHVVLVGTLQSYGLVRRQLALEIAGLALVTAASGSALLAGAPLWGVAAAASAAAAATWGGGTLVIRRWVPGASGVGRARFALSTVAQGAALAVALGTATHAAARTVIYAMLAAGPTLAAARAAREHGWR